MFLPAAVSARVLPAVSAASNMSAPPRGGEGGGGVWKCIHCAGELPTTVRVLQFCPFCSRAQDIPPEQATHVKEPVLPAVSAAVQKPENVKPDTGTSNEPRTPNLYPSLTDTSLLDISSDSDSYGLPQESPLRKRRNEDGEPRGGEKKRARSIDGTPSPHPPPPMETPQGNSPIDAKPQIQPDVRDKLRQRVLAAVYYDDEDLTMMEEYLPLDTKVERDHPSTLTRPPISSREPDLSIVKVERKTPPPHQPPPGQPPPQTPHGTTYADKAALSLDPKTPKPVSCV